MKQRFDKIYRDLTSITVKGETRRRLEACRMHPSHKKRYRSWDDFINELLDDFDEFFEDGYRIESFKETTEDISSSPKDNG